MLHACRGKTLGDIDGVTGPELYIGMFRTVCDGSTGICSSESRVYRVRFTGLLWDSSPIATLAGHIDSLWIGDGDRDGTFELYVGHGTRHADQTSQVRFAGGQWQATSLPGWGSESGKALVVVGDGNRDGKSEVYVANYYGNLRKLTYTPGSGWSSQTLVDPMTSPEGAPVHPTAMFLGDADSDGSQELYLATSQGEVYQVRFDGAAWKVLRISWPIDPSRDVHGDNGLLVVGDGDGDGRREVYAALSFSRPEPGLISVTRTYKVSLPAPDRFDATFTGVRGNEWWIQANVLTAGGTLAKVDVRLNSGAWQPLTKQSWGGWAASYHAVQGTVLQLRATSTLGATDLSDCYRWIPAANTDAARTACST